MALGECQQNGCATKKGVKDSGCCFWTSTQALLTLGDGGGEPGATSRTMNHIVTLFLRSINLPWIRHRPLYKESTMYRRHAKACQYGTQTKKGEERIIIYIFPFYKLYLSNLPKGNQSATESSGRSDDGYEDLHARKRNTKWYMLNEIMRLPLLNITLSVYFPLSTRQNWFAVQVLWFVM